MEKGLFTFGNIYFAEKGKKDVECSASELIHRLSQFYNDLLRYVFRAEKTILSAKKFSKVQFNSSTFEYNYPDDVFLKSCYAKVNLKRNLNKIKKLLTVILEILRYYNVKRKKREVYYKAVNVFNDQQTLDEMLKLLCIHIGCKRSWMNIFASFKGVCYGKIALQTPDGVIDLFNPTYKAIGIPISFDNYEITAKDFEYVLIVEKETCFYDLLSADFHTHFPNIFLVTAKGYPDYHTKEFIKNLFRMNTTALFLYLGDFDPFGFDILTDYMFGSPLVVYENNSLPIILPIGVSAEDVEYLDKKHMLPTTETDATKISELLQKPYFNLPDAKVFTNDFEKVMRLKLSYIEGNLEWIRKNRLKAEIESLVCSKIDMMQYISHKIGNLIQN